MGAVVEAPVEVPVGAPSAASSAASGACEPRNRGCNGCMGVAGVAAALLGGSVGPAAETLASEEEPNFGAAILLPTASARPSSDDDSDDTDRRLKLLTRFFRGDAVAGRVTDSERACRVLTEAELMGRRAETEPAGEAGHLGSAPGSDMMVSGLVGRSS